MKKGVSFVSENRKEKLVKSLKLNPLLRKLFSINKKKRSESEEKDDSIIKHNDIIKNEIHLYRVCQMDNMCNGVKHNCIHLPKQNKMTKSVEFTRNQKKSKTVSFPPIANKEEIVIELKNKFNINAKHKKTRSLNFFGENDFYFLK
jgi:hypothetical protein